MGKWTIIGVVAVCLVFALLGAGALKVNSDSKEKALAEAAEKEAQEHGVWQTAQTALNAAEHQWQLNEQERRAQRAAEHFKAAQKDTVTPTGRIKLDTVTPIAGDRIVYQTSNGDWWQVRYAKRGDSFTYSDLSAYDPE